MIQTRKRRVSREASIQAPTGGLNARDPLAAMKETEAVTMDNYFPTPSSVDSRNGNIMHTSGFSAPVETLASYSNGVSDKLFAFSNKNIYDVTAAGSLPAPSVTGLGNSRFETTLMGTAGGIFLLCVNGLDKMRVYTGSTWYADGTTTTVTGFDTANAASVNIFKNRVWFVERDSMSAWYLPVASIGGTAVELDLSSIFRMGGYLTVMANWTIDNAAGIDDYAVFITSEGEVALYKGTDPSSATTWALVGTFRMGRPIGRRCWIKAGADVLVLTSDGAFPLSKALLTDRTQMNLAATNKISDLINFDVSNYQINFGWQPILYPQGNKLIINVPTVESVESHQYVMNTTHGAWCRFTAWNACCFETLNDRLYYGDINSVRQADVGRDDNGDEIIGVVQQAYNYFGSKGVQKKFQMAKPIIRSEGSIIPAILMNVDFQENRTMSDPYYSGTAGTLWDTGFWDTSSWTSGDSIVAKWQSISAIGVAGGLRISTSLKDLSCKWISTDILYEQGGAL